MSIKHINPWACFLVFMFAGVHFLQAQEPGESSETTFKALLLEKGEHRQMVVPGQFAIVRHDVPKARLIRGFITAVTEDAIVLGDQEIALSSLKKITIKNFQQQRSGIWVTLSGFILPLAAGGVVELADKDWALRSPVSFDRFNNTVAAASTAAVGTGITLILASQRRYNSKRWNMEILDVSPLPTE